MKVIKLCWTMCQGLAISLHAALFEISESEGCYILNKRNKHIWGLQGRIQAPPPPAIYITDLIQAWRFEKHESGNSFGGGGVGGRGMSCTKTLGEAPPPLNYLHYQGQSKKFNAVFLFHDPPPSPSFWIRPWVANIM